MSDQHVVDKRIKYFPRIIFLDIRLEELLHPKPLKGTWAEVSQRIKFIY